MIKETATFILNLRNKTGKSNMEKRVLYVKKPYQISSHLLIEPKKRVLDIYLN